MTGPLNHLLASSPMPNMDYPGNAEARMLATASKRKLQRVRGAVAKLAALDPSTLSRNYERELVRAEEEVSRAHRDLTSQLEKLDGGDLLKRTRTLHGSNPRLGGRKRIGDSRVRFAWQAPSGMRREA